MNSAKNFDIDKNVMIEGLEADDFHRSKGGITLHVLCYAALQNVKYINAYQSLQTLVN